MNDKKVTEQVVNNAEAKDPAITTVTILGFNRTPSGLKLNTSPNLDIWVNSKHEFHAYKEKIGKSADFTARMVRTRAGAMKKVYDLNVTDVADEELDSIFDRTFEDAPTTEEAPY